MRTGKAGRDLIKANEGKRLTAYKCPAGVWTIGWGHTGPDVKPGMTISEAKAETLLTQDLRKFEQAIDGRVSVRLTQNQFDALVSLVYNIGEGNFAGSTVLKRVNAQNWQGAADAFSMWTKARVNGQLKVMPGLVKRRKQEAALFRSAMPKPISHEEIEADVADDMPQEVSADGNELKSMLLSKETLIGAAQTATGGGGLFYGLSQLDKHVQLALIAGAVLLLVTGLIIFGNRILARLRGDR